MFMSNSRTEKETTEISKALLNLYNIKDSIVALKKKNIEMRPYEKVQFHMLIDALKELDDYDPRREDEDPLKKDSMRPL